MIAAEAEARIVGTFEDELTGRADKAFQKFKKMAKATFKIVSAAAAIIFLPAIKAAADMSAQIAETETLLGNVSAKVRAKLIEDVQAIRIKYGQLRETATKALFDITSAGFQAADGMIVLEESAKLAVAGVSDASKTADLLTTSLNAYGQGAEFAARNSDIFFETQRRGKTTITELAADLGKLLPTAKLAGVTLEEVGASVATITASGIRTNETVTAMNALLLAISAPGGQAAKVFDEMGVEVRGANGELRPFLEIISQFRGKDLSMLKQLIPSESGIKAIATLADKYELLQENLRGIDNANGANQRGFERMGQEANFQFNQIKELALVALENIGFLVTKSETFNEVMKAGKTRLKEFGEQIKQNETLLKNIGKQITDDIKLVWDPFGSFLGKVADGFRAIAAAGLFVRSTQERFNGLMKESNESMRLAKQLMADIGEKGHTAADGAMTLNNANRQVVATVKEAVPVIKELNTNLEESSIEYGETFDQIRPLGDFFPILTGTIGELNFAWKDHIQVQQDAQVQAFERQKTATKTLRDIEFEIDLLNAEVVGRKDLIPLLRAERQFKQILGRDLNTKELAQLKERFEIQNKLNSQLEQQKALGRAAGGVLERGIEGYIRKLQDGENRTVAFKNVVSAALFDIQNEFIKIGLINPLKNAATRGINELLDIGGFADKLLTPGTPSKRAFGGDARKGQPIIVGDGGEPEILFPQQNSTVVPLSAFGRSQSNDSGITVIQNISFPLNSDGNLREQIVAILPALKEEIAEYTAENVSRRTELGRKFRS